MKGVMGEHTQLGGLATIAVSESTPEQREAARRVIEANSTSPEDQGALLAALGLT